VLRFDDRGVGKSGGKQTGATSADFATDAHAAVTYLKGRKEIDPGRIGLVGHSEGGLIAPMVAIAHPDDVAFIALLAGPGLPGDEVIRTQLHAFLKAKGEKPETTQLMARMQEVLVAAAKKPGTDDERKQALTVAMQSFADSLSAQEKKLLKFDEAVEVEKLALAQLGAPWMAYFLSYDPRPVLAKVRCPVLAVNGEKDIQVIPVENLAAIEKAVTGGGNAQVTTKVFPDLNHLFQTTRTGLPTEYGQIEETLAPAVLEYLAEWVLKQK
jgi:pimeloyl-ACP methyl ester carboxylesterase